MSSYRKSVYWKDQCQFCENSIYCEYRDKVELLQARLNEIELETTGCYGTISFWCDYYREDEQKVADASRMNCEACDDSNGAIEFVLPKLDLDWPPEPDTLFILMTRGERRVRESVNKAFGNISHVVIDVDGEKHEYDADALISLLEEFEVR